MVPSEMPVPLDPDAALALDTPAVVVDIDRLDTRIGAMAAAMQRSGVALRPHAKTHKSFEIARRQLAAGAKGLTVATLGEASRFAANGFEDLFIAFPLIATGPKVERIREMVGRCRLSVGADSVVGVDALARAFRGSAATPPAVIIEIDVGGERTGVRPEAAGPLARHAADLGLDVRGIFTHGGHGYGGRQERLAAADDEIARLGLAATSLRSEGIEPVVISAGSTPTATLSAVAPVNEERPGTYVFGDRQQAYLADRPLDDVALLVASTVVSHGSGHGFVVDAGAKILAKDVAPYFAGHGSVVGYPEAIISRVNDHHGVVDLPQGAPRPAIGEVIWIVPNHVCPVVNLVDAYVVAQGGRVVDQWPVDARGQNS